MIRAASSRFRSSFRGRGSVRPSWPSLAGFDTGSAPATTRRQEEGDNNKSAFISALPVIAVFPVRSFSSSSSSSSSDGGAGSTTDAAATTTGSTDPSSVDETLNKLFQDSQQVADASDALPGDAWYNVAEQVATEWTPTWYNFADHAIMAVHEMHDISGLEYGWSIVATTVALRVVLFPVMVMAQQTTSRMAHVQPELQQLKLNYERLGTPSRKDQMEFSKNMKNLFKRYNVKPFRAFMGPIVQLPAFMGMFFGLRKMPDIFPETLNNGGMFWFPDLTVPDPLYILPLTSCATFVGLIEMGRSQMLAQSPGAQGQIMVNLFRLMALLSLPVCLSFHSGMLCYWTTNNVITMGQTALLKTKSARDFFGIWEPPKPVPGQEAPNLMQSVDNLAKRVQGLPITEEDKIKKHNQELEAKKTSSRMSRAARRRQSMSSRRGITGTKNRW